MQKSRIGAARSGLVHVRVLAIGAMLAAMSIVCGKVLAFNLGNVLRISFENLPILLGGMIFGPVWGAVIGVVADLVGCLLVGYAVNPVVTLGAAVIGTVGGLTWRLSQKLPYGVSVLLTVLQMFG